MNILDNKTKNNLIGKFGSMQKKYLLEHDRAMYNELISNDLLTDHLINFDKMLNEQVKIITKCMIKNYRSENGHAYLHEHDYALILKEFEKHAEEIVVKQYFI